MTIDQGGLNYPIEVVDKFSTGLRNFRDDIENSRKSVQELREELSRLSAARSGGSRRGGPSEAVKQAREERGLAKEKLKAERTLQQARVLSAQDAQRAAIKQTKIEQDAAKTKVRQAAIDRAAKAESVRASELQARIERNRAQAIEKAEAKAAKARDKAVRAQERATAKAKAAADRALRDQAKANEQRAQADARAQTRADRLAASAARARAAVVRSQSQIDQANTQLAAKRKAADDRAVLAQQRLIKARNDAAAKAAKDAAALAAAQARAQVAADRAATAAATKRAAAQQKLDAARARAAAKAAKDSAVLAATQARQNQTAAAATQRAAAKAQRDAASLAAVTERNDRAREDAARRRAREDAAALARQRAAQLSQARGELALEAARARALKAQERIRQETQKTGGAAGQLLFTFRRLVGILAIFTLARELVRGLVGAVRQAFFFNTQLETSILSIQSLLSATGKLVTATGRNVEGAEAFAAANAESRRQVALLRVEGLKTAATFDQLLFAYQSALGPGIAAGLSPDEVRGFAVRIAQAAAAIGVPQDQLAEEVRSILAGTITQRTTRIAAVLGIGNEDIKRAKEAGQLADFLLEKFGAFQFAGEASLATFSVIIANLKDATSQLLGQGGQQFFGQVKEGLRGILDELVKTTSFGTIINPKAVAIVSAFFSILTAIGAELRVIFATFTLDGAVASANTLATVVNSIVGIAGEFAAGFVGAFVSVSEIVRDLASDAQTALTSLGFSDTAFLGALEAGAAAWGQILAYAITFRGVITLLKAPITLVALAWASIARTALVLVASLKLVAPLFAAILSPVGLIVTGVLAIAAAIALVVGALQNDFIRSIEIGGLKIGTIADTIKSELQYRVKQAALFFENGWSAAISTVRILFVKLANFFADKILAITETVLSLVAVFSDAAERAERDIQKLRKDIDRGSDILERNEKRRRAARLADLRKEYEENERARKQRLAAIQEAELTGPRQTPGEAFTSILDGLKSSLGFSEDTNVALAENDKRAADFVATLSQVPPVVGQANQSLEKQSQVFDKLKQSAERSRDSLSLAFAAQGVEGAERRILLLRQKSTTEVRESVKAFAAQAQQSKVALEAVEAREGAITSQILKQKTANREQISSLATLGAQLSDLAGQRAAAEQSVIALTRERRVAEASGDDDREAALTKRIAIVKREGAAIAQNIATAERQARTQVEALNLSEEGATKLAEQVSELVRLNAQRTLQEQQLGNAAKERGRIEDSVNQATERRLRAIIVLEQSRLDAAQRQVATELTNARIIEAARSRTAGVSGPQGGTEASSRRAVADAQARLNSLIQQTAESRRQLGLQEAALRAEIAGAESAELRADLERRLISLQGTFNANLEISKIKAGEIAQELQRLATVLNTPITAGFDAGLESFIIKAGDSFEQVKTLAENSLGGFADTLGSTLADALDPTKKLDLVSRFRTFFQDITTQVLQLITRLLIVRALQNTLGLSGTDDAAAQAAASKAVVAATVAAAAAAQAEAAVARAAALSVAGLGGGGLATGGFVGSTLPGRAGAAFANAPGLADGGGIPRPKGLHPSDRIPLWGALGEFMQPVKAVRAYGADFMESIRQRKIDPNLVRAMMGTKRAGSARRAVSGRGAGYVDGGKIDGKKTAVLPAVSAPTIINAFNEAQLIDALASAPGQEVLVNVMRSRFDDTRPAQ